MCLSCACVFTLYSVYQCLNRMKVFCMCMPLCVCCKDMSDISEYGQGEIPVRWCDVTADPTVTQ